MKELVAAGCSFVEGYSMVVHHKYSKKLKGVDIKTAVSSLLKENFPVYL